MAKNAFDLPFGLVLDGNGNLNVPWGQWFSRINTQSNAAQQSGVTADRPTGGLWIGRQYYDLTLNKPVYVSAVKPTVWRDAAGTVV